MLTALLPQSLYFFNRYKLCILRSNGTQCIEHEYHYGGIYNVYVKEFFFVITEIVHMNEKTGTSVSSEKEKVEESQSRSVTPSLDTSSGTGLGHHTSSFSALFCLNQLLHVQELVS